ncbi:MAG: hypothetical protein JJE18_02360 [Eubacteriaceae bacterium]|nr:hypothetical protein [Eubacteriaceae bacterium]
MTKCNDANVANDRFASFFMQMADSFSEALNEIIGKTKTINSSLKRIVYIKPLRIIA